MSWPIVTRRDDWSPITTNRNAAFSLGFASSMGEFERKRREKCPFRAHFQVNGLFSPSTSLAAPEKKGFRDGVRLKRTPV